MIEINIKNKYLILFLFLFILYCSNYNSNSNREIEQFSMVGKVNGIYRHSKRCIEAVSNMKNGFSSAFGSLIPKKHNEKCEYDYNCGNKCMCENNKCYCMGNSQKKSNLKKTKEEIEEIENNNSDNKSNEIENFEELSKKMQYNLKKNI